MFNSLKKKFGGGVKKFSGKTDFLEAVCASSALVAFADGGCSDKELETAMNTTSTNPELSQAFKANEIEKTLDAMLKRAQAGRTGRMGLYKEIDDVAENEEMAAVVYSVALDVAESEGGIGADEQKVLDKIAQKLGINPDNFDV